MSSVISFLIVHLLDVLAKELEKAEPDAVVFLQNEMKKLIDKLVMLLKEHEK